MAHDHHDRHDHGLPGRRVLAAGAALPAALVGFDNTQDDANHVHALWRDLAADVGRRRARRALPHRPPPP
jgi:hypothetical protein